MASAASRISLRLALAAALVSGVLAPFAGAARTESAQIAPQVAQAETGLEAAYVRGVQKELAAHGYKPGPIDGVAGPQTRAAVRAYQADAGLEVDGKADKRLLDHIKFALPKVYAFGAPKTGHALDLQRALAKRGYYLGPQDGVAGPATYRALDRFQQDAGQPPDTEINSRAVLRVQEAPENVKAGPAF
ncbi:peptidoglycan-binding domain-containing protein [Pelagibius sp. 7325]|uniref:peptidoglycan-binding domain-containing protein n=1 Tax=Pelagibius sp. 7325 TaxID=3131994 RepID=UPI0030EB3DC9